MKDPGREISLQTFTQLTPIPAAVVALAQEDTPSDYPLRWSGLAVTIGSLMARNLQVTSCPFFHIDRVVGLPLHISSYTNSS